MSLFLLLVACVTALMPGREAVAAGTWTTLAHQAPDDIQLMLLLPDGTVMAAAYGGNTWYRLTPDSKGSYVNGTWTMLSSMHNSRLYYSSDVMPNGQVLVAGGEYGSGGALAEVYDPMRNLWTLTPTPPVSSFDDAVSEVLPNGTVMSAPVYPSASDTVIYTPSTNTWSAGPNPVNGQDEVPWVKLADGSILTPDGQNLSERYIPSQNAWVADAAVPVALYDANGETGPAFLLPNGNVFTVGGTGHSAIYTPSGTASPGSWAAGPDVPGGNGMPDAPGAMMVNGVVLLATAPAGTYNGPVTFYEYDYVTNAFTAVSAPSGGSTLNDNSYTCAMLALPDGTVLFADSSTQLYEYAPSGSALAAGTPSISSVTPNSDGTCTLTGTLLNGISEGAAYGDDLQMASNYPIVRLSNTAGNVYYARTYNWSSTGVMTGTATETATFTLPLGLPAGTYNVAVVANGNASSTASLTTPFVAGDIAPTVATAAKASPSPVSGTTTNLSVLGATNANGGESTLIYTWTTTSSPNGIPTPSFSTNGTNAAKNITATFYATGSYTFKVTITDAAGLSTSSSVSVTVNQTFTSIAIAASPLSITAGQTAQFTATADDQFGHAMNSQPGFTWAMNSGGGTVNSSGLYTSPATGTAATVTVKSGTIQATGPVYVVDSPWQSADIGSPGDPGWAYDTNGVFTVTGEGSDIWGTSDQFHYVWRTLNGDGTLVARVVSQPDTGGWAKAGVMMRNSTAGGDQFAMMLVTPENGVDLQYRTTSGGSASDVGNQTGPVAPYWVKLVRSGNTFTGYYSPDGYNWTTEGSTSITMGTSIDAGLAVDSLTSNTLNTTTFDNVTRINALGDTLAVVQGTPGTVNVLANDTGPSGTTLSVTSYTQPTKGTLVNNGGGSFTYTPSSTAVGSDSFTYTVSDGIGDTATALVNITITGLWAHYPFNEGSGTTSADATGNGYTCTLDGATWTTGIEGTNGLAFAGTDTSYATIPALNLNTNAVTITAWVNRNGSQSSFTGLVFCRAGTTVCGLTFGTANELRYTWNNSSSTYNWNSGLVVPNAQWTFVALVITPTNATIYMQPLGGSMTSATNSVANTAAAFDGVTDFGKDPTGTTRHFKGSMDEVRIYNLSLSSAAIAGLANPDPTVATVPTATMVSSSSLTVALAATGASNFYPASSLTYTWSATNIPVGAAAPTFSANGTNAAQSIDATTNTPGAYTFQVTITDPDGGTTTSSVNITVPAPVPALPPWGIPVLAVTLLAVGNAGLRRRTSPSGGTRES